MKEKTNIDIFREKILESKEILITSHHNADGDAIGSAAALALFLKKLNKNTNIIIPNDFPAFLHWLPGVELITVYHHNAEKSSSIVNSADLLISVDYNEPKRLKKAAETVFSSEAYKVLIDHHPNPSDVFDLQFSETGYGSTSEFLFNIICELGYSDMIDSDIAECLFTGIMTDTGNFSFSCSYPEVWETVAKLIDLGVDRNKVHSLVYDNYTVDRMKLMGFSLDQKMTVIPELNTAFIVLKRSELDKFNHQPGDTEGFVNLPFSIKNIKFCVLFIEKRDHVKISFRSRGNFSVNEFASSYFNGGGHMNAAGGEFYKPIDETVEYFLSLLTDYKNELQ